MGWGKNQWLTICAYVLIGSWTQRMVGCYNLPKKHDLYVETLSFFPGPSWQNLVIWESRMWKLFSTYSIGSKNNWLIWMTGIFSILVDHFAFLTEETRPFEGGVTVEGWWEGTQKCAIGKEFSAYTFSYLPTDSKDRANQAPLVRPHSQDWTISLLVSIT